MLGRELLRVLLEEAGAFCINSPAHERIREGVMWRVGLTKLFARESLNEVFK